MLEAHARANTFVVTARGEWDFMTAPAMAQMLRVATSGQWSVAVVDLRQVEFMDVAGCDPLCTAAADCAAASIDFMLVFPSPRVVPVLEACGLTRFVVPVEQLPHPDEVADLFADVTEQAS